MFDTHTGMPVLPQVTRRATLGGMGAAMVLGKSSISLGASSANARLVIINIRGGLDGLATVIPYGDPALAGLRSGLVPSNMIKLDNFYALHPSMPNFHAMYQSGQALAVHAVGPTVATRSHFAAQDYLQMGAGQTQPSGWLNRALASTGASSTGLSMSAEVPQLLRGTTMMSGFAPDPFDQIATTLSAQVSAMSAADPLIGPADTLGCSNRAMFNQILGIKHNIAGSSLSSLAGVAGSLLGGSSGLRVAALETDNFDTHEDQNMSLPGSLTQLDTALATLKTNLGSAWSSTVVLTMTEFGRTAYQNGTQGTDHGTGFAVLLAGGAVSGGRIIANWPGLGASKLFQGRDLAPTVDFRSIAMGVLISQLGVSASAQQTIFPGSTGIAPMSGLVRS